MAKLNYATEYLQTLEQMFPYVLYFEFHTLVLTTGKSGRRLA